MKIGMLAENFGMDSLKHVFGGLKRTLGQRHEVVYQPLEYFWDLSTSQGHLGEEFIKSCDLLVGRIDESILKSRERIGGHPPLVGFLMGTMSRGAMELAAFAGNLKSTDMLVGNCTADLEIARKFFSNVQMRKMPFGVDESVFYPADETERRKIKTELGFNQDDRILLYAGRITIEKNLHTLLRMFSILQDLIPNLHLVVAGEMANVPFTGMGVYSLSLTATMMKLIRELDLSTESIHFVGRKSTAQLRNLYAISDVLVNMTLHHDENFGLSQVEAMACGTPVVGTRWGGLKDTILHGETGYHVSTVITGSGVKANWWEAINRIVSLLEDEELLKRFREQSRAHALENFSNNRYTEFLESIVNECANNGGAKREPIGLTDFAARFWHTCMLRESDRPPFQRGAESFELYKELISPFTGLTESSVPTEVGFDAKQLLIIAVPVQIREAKITLDDPIFPIEIVVPEGNRQTCEAILEIMRKEPVISFGRLEKLIPESARHCMRSSLQWMLGMGVLLRTNPIDGSVDPENIGTQMSKPLFSIQRIDYLNTDVIAFK